MKNNNTDITHAGPITPPTWAHTGNGPDHGERPKPATDHSPRHRLIDGREAAAKAGCSHRHWLRLCDAGLAPAGVKLMALRRWSETEIDQWIAAGCPPLRPTAA